MERRPFDTLNDSIDKEVTIQLKEGQEIKGELKAFDAHMNLIVDKDKETLLVRGDNILFITFNKE
jgi:small nuclear ribonucleoprotein (snRNP)-like protein|tara:strand:+ start:856 stop:1050 length:195 start_codon:yes stop_codon:yes gene_type:complete